MAQTPTILWPGVTQVLRASFTISQGITPSLCNLEISPQLAIPTVDGDLIWSYAGIRLAFRGCRLDQASLRYDAQGLIWSLSIKDRRWKWQFGELSGRWNLRREDGSLDTATKATPQQLIGQCLKAMGERSYSLSQVPNLALPEVNWDRDNPSQALAALCDTIGCRVVLRLDNSVQIVRTGIGDTVPLGSIIQDQIVSNPPPIPDEIKVVGGKTRFQPDFLLEAVGKDTDGKIKPVDDLSYAPTSGWGNECPPFFSGVSTTKVNNLVPRELAKNTVWKWYRIKMVDPANLQQKPFIPGWGRLHYLWQILPLESVQISGVTATDGTFTSSPSMVYGIWYDGGLGYANTQSGTIYTRPFSVNQDEGIVEFTDYVFYLTAEGIEEAELFLRTACSVKDKVYRTYNRYQRSFINPGTARGTGPRILKHEEIVGQYVPTYDNRYKVLSIADNLKSLSSQADHYLAAAKLDYLGSEGRDVTYAGLVPISLNGIIQQVTFVSGQEGTTTRATLNSEWDPAVPDYSTRRLIEKIRAVELKKLEEDTKKLQEARGKK